MPRHTAVSHLTLFPQFHCGEDCCRHSLIYDDQHAINQLKNHANWWPCTFVGAFVSMIAHVFNHPSNVQIVFRFSEDQAWSRIAVNDQVEKLVCVELTKEHYTVMVMDLLVEEIHHWNAFADASTSCDHAILNERCQATLDNLLFYTKLCHQSEVWSRARAAPFVQQHDGSSCGPIAVLAIFEEISGEPFLGLVRGSMYDDNWRIMLIDWYMHQF